MLSTFVLETKQICLPEFPKAFNASIVRWHGVLVMAFRDIPDPKTPFTSHLGIVWLDDNFVPISKPEILPLRDSTDKVPCRAEDPRLLVIENRLFMLYSDNPEPKISKGGFRMYIAELEWDGKNFGLARKEALTSFEGESRAIREKGWVPFDYAGHLLLAYKPNPHRILYPLPGSGSCMTVTSTESPIEWPWGELRGGTPALLLDDEEYLSFFHSSIEMASVQSEGKKIAHYFIGAYTFSAKLPFALRRITRKPIVGKGFYNGKVPKPYWQPLRVVFPCGILLEEKAIWISYGRQDCEIWVAKLDREELLKNLFPIKYGEDKRGT